MTPREIKAVSEAIEDSYSVSRSMHEVAQAAIAASDSQYVKGLVDCLHDVMQSESRGVDMKGWITKFLQQLPEDRR